MTTQAVMLSGAKHLVVAITRPFAALRVTTWAEQLPLSYLIHQMLPDEATGPSDECPPHELSAFLLLRW